MKVLYLLMIGIVIFSTSAHAQSLDDLLIEIIETKEETELVNTTFKSVYLINSHTTKKPAEKELIFLISHRFGYLNSGFPDLYGLDNATVRFGFEYGILNKLALGFGRSTYKRNYDFYAKYAILEQSRGKKSIPVTLSLLGVTNISSARWANTNSDYLFAHRMSYTLQLLVSRQFNETFSFQLMPTYIHRNLVKTTVDKNDVFALGAGWRAKLTNRVAITGEYHLITPDETSRQFTAPLSLGFDIETGGHVFQLFFTNSAAIYDAAFITETTDKWIDGNIRFGFNISRTF